MIKELEKKLQEVEERISALYKERRDDSLEKMPYKVLIPIAKVLGTTPMYLLGNDDDQNHAKLDNNIKKWINVVGETEFTDEEFNELANFAKYLISKRNAHE